LPGQGKNVALAAHRYRFRPPSTETFYLLDKLEQGDEIVVWSKGTRYQYRVDSLTEVMPDDVSVVEDHGREELTLVTCTPLFSTARRLIVTAYPVGDGVVEASVSQ
jgi:sortase A